MPLQETKNEVQAQNHSQAYWIQQIREADRPKSCCVQQKALSWWCTCKWMLLLDALSLALTMHAHSDG